MPLTVPELLRKAGSLSKEGKEQLTAAVTAQFGPLTPSPKPELTPEEQAAAEAKAKAAKEAAEKAEADRKAAVEKETKADVDAIVQGIAAAQANGADLEHESGLLTALANAIGLERPVAAPKKAEAGKAEDTGKKK